MTATRQAGDPSAPGAVRRWPPGALLPEAGFLTAARATLARPDAGLADREWARQVVGYHAGQRVPTGFELLRRDYGTARVDGTPHRLPALLFRPLHRTVARPGVVLIHGGGWNEGDEWELASQGARLAARTGYVVASIGYRLSGQAGWPAQLADAKAAVRWLRAHAAGVGCDPDRIAVMGGSAGGHLALAVALLPDSVAAGELVAVDGADEATSSGVEAAVALYPVTDLAHPEVGPRLAAVVADLLGTADATAAAYRKASPVHYLRPDAPPMLTITGAADTLTPLAMVTDFDAAARRAGAVHRLVVVPRAGHAFDFLPDHADDVVEQVAAFLAEVLGGAAPAACG